MLQLTSIKRLKKVQIEKHLEDIWKAFSETAEEIKESENREIKILQADQLNSICLESGLKFSPQMSGIYDLTSSKDTGLLHLLLIKPLRQGQFATLSYSGRGIQNILLERTGMGRSGESYLVGQDYHLRSLSRFFPKEKPYNFFCRYERSSKSTCRS